MLHDLRRLAGEFDQLVVCGEGPDLDWVRNAGFRVLAIPINRKLTPARDVAALLDLVRILRRERPDLVHTYTPKAGLIGQLAARIAGVGRRVHSCRGLLYWDGMASWRRPLYRATDRTTFETARRTIFISEADRSYAVREGLCPPDRARVTGSGIDLGTFRRPPDAHARRAEWRARLKVAEGTRLILTAGRFVVDKGYQELAQAAFRVLSQRNDVVFVWVAPTMGGEEARVSDDILKDPCLGVGVRKIGRQEDMVGIYLAADLLVHPSFREGIPRVVMEAAAMGVPLVISDIPGNREVVRDDSVGRLFRVRDATAIESAILSALTNWDDTAARAVRAQSLIERGFSADAVAARVASVYREVLS